MLGQQVVQLQVLVNRQQEIARRSALHLQKIRSLVVNTGFSSIGLDSFCYMVTLPVCDIFRQKN